jgi:hypothetical protein
MSTLIRLELQPVPLALTIHVCQKQNSKWPLMNNGVLYINICTISELLCNVVDCALMVFRRRYQSLSVRRLLHHITFILLRKFNNVKSIFFCNAKIYFEKLSWRCLLFEYCHHQCLHHQCSSASTPHKTLQRIQGDEIHLIQLQRYYGWINISHLFAH